MSRPDSLTKQECIEWSAMTQVGFIAAITTCLVISGAVDTEIWPSFHPCWPLTVGYFLIAAWWRPLIIPILEISNYHVKLVLGATPCLLVVWGSGLISRCVQQVLITPFRQITKTLTVNDQGEGIRTVLLQFIKEYQVLCGFVLLSGTVLTLCLTGTKRFNLC